MARPGQTVRHAAGDFDEPSLNPLLAGDKIAFAEANRFVLLNFNGGVTFAVFFLIKKAFLTFAILIAKVITGLPSYFRI
ncbi:hypothetical protein [Pantoea sp. BAV 3049]|uniref:hypothetical protein n=1 Tax=Pantoea sp. BAV 3049 TaxID=2654188 RepID=UPI00131B47C2|nr:hypothetical protein [Pantoea sp. BAV 3049]